MATLQGIIDLPFAGQNKTYCVSYVQSKVYQEMLVEAPSPKAAERYFASKKPQARGISARKAYPGDHKPGIPVLVLTEKEERDMRASLLASDIEELDLSVRSFNSLRRANVKKISDLISMTEDEVKSLPNLGWKGFEEIVGVLSFHGERLASFQEQDKKPSLDSRIRSVAHYADSKEVRDAVLESDRLRNMTLDACYKIPGYEKLPLKEKNALYDLVKKAVSLSLAKDKDMER